MFRFTGQLLLLHVLFCSVSVQHADAVAQHCCGGVQVDGVVVEVALQWCSDSYSDNMLGFVNSIKTIDGGTHMDGFKSALTRTVNTLGKKSKILKDGDSNLSGDHIREGLGAIVSVKVGCFIVVWPKPWKGSNFALSTSVAGWRPKSALVIISSRVWYHYVLSNYE